MDPIHSCMTRKVLRWVPTVRAAVHRKTLLLIPQEYKEAPTNTLRTSSGPLGAHTAYIE
jgi:hypothetical protein